MKAPTSKTITNANLRSFLCEEHHMIRCVIGENNII